MTAPDERRRADLDAAARLAGLGVPLFVAPPDPAHPTGFALPGRWADLAQADPRIVESWRPGWALAMVTGVAADVVDVDTYAGGQVPAEVPRAYAVADTPSGGRHLLVAPLGVESRNGAYPGVDIKSGAPDGRGRGFAFLAPTERVGKAGGDPRPYRWRSLSGLDELAALRGASDGTGTLLRQRILDLRAGPGADDRPRRVAESAWRRECAGAVEALAADVARWAAGGWGGQARNGLLAASTRLARLSPEHAETGWREAFRRAGVQPDERDMAILESAVARAVPDLVVPDAELSPQDRFWLGGGFEPPPKPEPPPEGPRHAQVGGFRFLTEDEVEALPEPDRLVDGLLWRDSVARVFGPSGVGKTWAAIDLAAHVANGRAWLGLPVAPGAHRVLYVAAEGAPSLGPRYRLWRREHGLKVGLHTWPEAVAVLGENWPAFVEAARGLGPSLVVLDTQNAMTAGTRENSNDDAGDVIRALNALARATGACVLLVHHTGHEEQERARGASALYAGLDTELQLVERRGGVALLSRKQRYGRRLASLAIDVAARDDGWVLSAATDEPSGHFGTTDRDVRAARLSSELQRHLDGGARFALSVRGVRAYLTAEVGHAVDDKVIRDAVKILKEGRGMPAEILGMPADCDSA